MNIQQLIYIFHQNNDFSNTLADRCKMHSFLWSNAGITSAEDGCQGAGRLSPLKTVGLQQGAQHRLQGLR